MMRIARLFFILILSVFLGLWIHQEAGSLIISLKDKTISMPLWFAILAVFAGYFLCWIFLKILLKLLHIKQSLLRFSRGWSKRHAQLNTRRGLIEFSEGNWKRAEHYFGKAVTKTTADAADADNDASLLNYLVAARAAQEMGAPERRDDYLREAQIAIPEAKIAIELTQAQLQIVDEQWEQALATLSHLHSLVPYHPYVTKLLMKVYLALKDWPHLEELLPSIRHQKIINEKELEQLEDNVYSGLLTQAPQPISEEILKTMWTKFPKRIRRRVSLVIVYVTKLLECHAYCEAEYQCRIALKSEWNNILMELYGQCNVPEIEPQLRFAEGFLKYYPNNPYLLSALGRIYLRRQLWGKAKSTLLKSVQIQPDAKIYAELGELAEKMNEREDASHYYQKGLALGV